MDITTLFKLSSGLYIIGAKDDEKNAGCVVNTVLQSTSSPVTLSVCINKGNYTNGCIKKTKEFSVSILSEQCKESVLGVFGFQSSKDKDKFDEVSKQGTAFGLTPSGLPYLKNGVTGFIQCKVINFVDNYTHTIFIAEVQEAENISSEPPMTYEYYHKVIKGKAPKNASTYVAETNEPKIGGGSYKCGMCGYEYQGSKEEFEKLHDDYCCPICGVAKSMFAVNS